MAKENQTLPEFLLLGFADLRTLQTPLFWMVLLVYLATLLGNSVIIFLTQGIPELHSPMYFFLHHLSVVELLYTTDIMPRTLADLASPHPWAISFQGCAACMSSLSWASQSAACSHPRPMTAMLSSANPCTTS